MFEELSIGHRLVLFASLFPLLVVTLDPIRDDPYWTSRKNCLELIELSSINKVSLV